MERYDIPTLLTCDSRFIRNGAVLQQTAFSLSEIFSQPEVIEVLNTSYSAIKHSARFLNLLLYANSRGDSFAGTKFKLPDIVSILTDGEKFEEYENVFDRDLQSVLGSDYVDYKNLEISSSDVSKKSKFINNLLNKSNDSESSVKALNNGNTSTDYWVESVRLDFPTIPQPNSLDVVYSEVFHSQKYCVYGESKLPKVQSEITALTDVNKFNDEDILALFPPIRLYTRSPYMYKKYDGLDYDDDLGVLFKISGYNKRQIKKNIIEYPHLAFLDRVVKIKGKPKTIPFWKHIELDGEIVSTLSVWDKLPDTKKLPKTESFMNEYVTRKYLLDRDSGKIQNYPMRGDLQPFLTLYNTPQYYTELKYDPIDIGRRCVKSRQVFKYSRNPILNMIASGD